MLVDTIRHALEVTASLDGQVNLCPEDLAVQHWREKAIETLRIETLTRPPEAP